jgi:tetratricopeptide (TPR) repeat protein
MDDQDRIRISLQSGFSSLLKGETEAALIYFLKALDSEPGNPEATNGAGSCYVFQGEEQQAVDLLEKCIGLGKGTLMSH